MTTNVLEGTSRALLVTDASSPPAASRAGSGGLCFSATTSEHEPLPRILDRVGGLGAAVDTVVAPLARTGRGLLATLARRGSRPP